MNWNKILLSILFILISSYIALCAAIINKQPLNKFQNSYNATCAVKDEEWNTVGTGCLLENNLLITAAHVIDTNNDDIISPDEKIVKVQFGTGFITTAILVNAGMPNYTPNDWAFLELSDKPPCEGLKVSPENPQLGDTLYTFGCPDGKDLQLTSGLYTGLGDSNSICSVPIFLGNSGGAILNDKQEVVGIVSRIGNSIIERTLIFAADGPVIIDQSNYVTHQNFYCAAAGFAQENKELPDWKFRGWSMLFSLPVILFLYVRYKTLLV